MGAGPLVERAPADEVAGRYFNVLREARADPQAYDTRARRNLRELSDATGYTANMAILDDLDIVYVERCRSSQAKQRSTTRRREL